MQITVKSHIPDVMDVVERATRNGLIACGMTAETYAKQYETAVDTGRLRNSITHTEDDTTMIVGTNVYYAPYIEFGRTGGRAGLHYLKNSIAYNVDKYQQILQEALNAID